MSMLRLFLLAAVLLAITVSDIRTRKIPNVLVLAFVAVHLGTEIAQSANVEEALARAMYGMACYLAVSAILFLLAHLAAKVVRANGIGGGDVKLIAAFILVFGINKAMLACIIACVLALLFARMQGLGKSDAFPFGPFLSAGSIVCLLLGS